MHGMSGSPFIVPYGADETIYRVVDSSGAGSETEVERTDLKAVIADFLSGQFNCPIRVVAFNTLEHWTEDVSREVAAEIQIQSDMDSVPVPEDLKDFVEKYAGSTDRPGPITLALAGGSTHGRSASS